MPRKDTPTQPIQLPAEDLTATVLHGNRRVRATLDNLSVNGTDLLGPLVVVEGQQISIALEHEGALARVLAEVVRVDTADLLSDRVAVRFVEVPPEAQALIVRLVLRATQACGDVDVDEDRVTARIPRQSLGEDVDAATARVERKKDRR